MPNSITVEIGLPQSNSQNEHNNFCNIGRLAEVRFERAGFALFDRFGQVLHRLTGYFRSGVADTASK